jgi:hypothetical protein
MARASTRATHRHFHGSRIRIAVLSSDRWLNGLAQGAALLDESFGVALKVVEVGVHIGLLVG